MSNHLKHTNMSNVIKMKRMTADENHWYVDLSLEPAKMQFRKTVYLSNPADARKWSYVDKDTKAMYEKKAKESKKPKKTNKK